MRRERLRQSSRAPEVVPNRGCEAEPSCFLRKSLSEVGESLCQPVFRNREEPGLGLLHLRISNVTTSNVVA